MKKVVRILKVEVYVLQRVLEASSYGKSLAIYEKKDFTCIWTLYFCLVPE